MDFFLDYSLWRVFSVGKCFWLASCSWERLAMFLDSLEFINERVNTRPRPVRYLSQKGTCSSMKLEFQAKLAKLLDQ